MPGCSEARSDIENLDSKVLAAEADLLTKMATQTTEAEMRKIQTMAVPAAPVTDISGNEPTDN